MTSDKKIFYGWWVVIALFGVGTVGSMVRYSLTAFFPFISPELGWSRSLIGSGQTLTVLIYALLVPFVGRMTDRLGGRKTIFLGGLVNLCGWLLLSTMKSVWQLYLYYGFITAVAVGMNHYVPIQATGRKWFIKRAGLVGGILIAAFAVGTSIFIPLLTLMASSSGWRTTSLVYGSAVGLLILLLSSLVIRDTPESIGLNPDGEDLKQTFPDKKEVTMETWSTTEALKTSQFWLLFITYSLPGIPLNGLLAHLVMWGVDLGSSKGAAGIFITALTLPMAVAAPFGGWLGDRYGKRRIIAVGFLCAFWIMLWAWYGVHTPKQLILFGIMIGITLNLPIGLFAPYLGDLFGRANIGSLYGILTTGWGLIGGTGALLWGIMFDTTGNYNSACLVSVACYAIAVVAALLVRPIGPKPANI